MQQHPVGCGRDSIMVQAIRAAQPARRSAIRAPNWTVDGWRRGPLIRGALPVRFSVAARNPVAPQVGCVPTQRKVPPMPDDLRPCRRGRDNGARPCDDRSVADEAGRVDISQTSSGADRTSTMIVRDATGDGHVASGGGLATIGGQGVRYESWICEVAARMMMSRSGLRVTAPTGFQLRVDPLQRCGLRCRAS